MGQMLKLMVYDGRDMKHAGDGLYRSLGEWRMVRGKVEDDEKLV